MVPVEYEQSQLKKRCCFIRKGNIYFNIENTIELVLDLFEKSLEEKLKKMQLVALELIDNDV